MNVSSYRNFINETFSCKICEKLSWWQQHKRVSTLSFLTMVWRQAPIPCSRQSDSNFLGVGIWLVKAAPVLLFFVCFSESELWVSGLATEGKIWSGKRSWALSDSLMTRIITATANTIIFGFSGAQCIHCVWPESSGSACEECGLVDNKRTTDNEQWWCDDQDRASQISVLWCLLYLGLLIWHVKHMLPAGGAVDSIWAVGRMTETPAK